MPLSLDVWIYMTTAYLGVSITMFLLARLTPFEWENPHPCVDEPEELENELTLHNCFWHNWGSLMQQGSDIAPKYGKMKMLYFLFRIITSFQSYLYSNGGGNVVVLHPHHDFILHCKSCR